MLFISLSIYHRGDLANNSGGWSLVEVLAVLALVLLVGHLLLPDWSRGLAASHLRQQQQSFLLHLRQSHGAALTKQQSVTLCGWSASQPCDSNLTATSDTDDQGQALSFVDSNGDQQWQPQETLLHRQVLHPSLVITFNRGAYVQFTAVGTSGQAGTWTLCWPQLTTGYKVILSSSGSLRSTSASCHANG